MAARSNAMTELTRFWLQAKHHCLVDESLPVPVPRALSDLDLVAITSNLQQIKLPNGSCVGPRMILEVKDEHDWEPTGREFGHFFKSDLEKMMGKTYIPEGTKGVKFTMLRQQHYEKAFKIFGDSSDFDRIFIVHAIDKTLFQDYEDLLRSQRITVMTIREIVADLYAWYETYERKAGLRHTLVGDLWHLLMGFCRYGPHPDEVSQH